MTKVFALALALHFCAGSVFGQAAVPTRIGAAGAVKGLVRAQTPGAVGRVIGSGKPLFLNDHVTTDAAGRLQVMLLDETIFTLGPNSDMVLDEFVYDPVNDAGKVTARVTKGVFRFVTGKVARRDPASMKVKLPVGTIGIRGTMAIGQAGAEGSTAILLGPGANGNSDEPRGAISFENGGVTREIDQPGEGVTCAAGAPPSPVTDLSQTALQLEEQLSPAPQASNSGADGGDAASSGGSTSEESGQQTAAAKGDSSEALGDTEASGGTSFLVQNAAFDTAESGVADGVATWESIRQNITIGDGFFFSGHAPISCTGGGCLNSSSPNNPQGALQLYIDFGARTIGGATAQNGPSGSSGSFIHSHNINSLGDTIEQAIGLGGSGLNPISFSALSGAASLTLQTGSNMSSSTTGNPGGTGNFDGTVITLLNAGGVAAASAKVDMVFTGTNSSAQSINHGGQFEAPRQGGGSPP